MKKISFLLFVTLAALATLAQENKPQNLSIINGPVVESVTGNSAVIAWTTNTGASSVVRYGTSPNNLDLRGQSPYVDNEGAAYQTHRVSLRHLSPGTTYYYVADSGQGEGTGTEANSVASSFTTAGGAAPSTATAIPSAQTASRVPLYRLVASSGDHFLTTSEPEKTVASARGYRLEGIAGYILSAPAQGLEPFYRLVSNTGKTHFYTTSSSERDRANGFHSEGIAGYIASSQLPGTTALYRLSNSTNSDHFYTTSSQEKQGAMQGGYRDEGVAGYIWTTQQ